MVSNKFDGILVTRETIGAAFEGERFRQGKASIFALILINGDLNLNN